jgi:hypothetical protein
MNQIWRKPIQIRPLEDVILQGSDPSLDMINRARLSFPTSRAIEGSRVEIANIPFDDPPVELFCLAMGKLAPFRYFLTGSAHATSAAWKPQLDLRHRYTPEGHTLLHLAVLHNSFVFVHVILAFGAVFDESLVDLPLLNANTPLHLAVVRRSVDIVGDLLRYGADPFALNSRRLLPLDLAFGDPEIGKKLIEYMVRMNWDAMKTMAESHRKGKTEKRTNMAALADAIPKLRPLQSAAKCTHRGCETEKRTRKCQVCLVSFCPFHIDRHVCEPKAQPVAFPKFMEEWGPGDGLWF